MTAPVPPTTPVRMRAPLLTQAEYHAWRGGRRRVDLVAHVAATGMAPIRITGSVFYWTCPGCGGTASGELADEPVSGWDNPRWVRTGLWRLTLSPSLGCPRWREGTCVGHWWLRDGELVAA